MTPWLLLVRMGKSDWELIGSHPNRVARVVLRHEEEIDASTAEPLDPVEEWQLTRMNAWMFKS
jgi:hypothetical protein